MSCAPTTSVATHGCDACGAALVLARESASATCSYCGSKLVDRSIATELDRVCAFRVSRRAAAERLRAHLSQAWFAPRAVRRLARSNQLQTDELRGVLVPFVAYGARVDLRYHVDIGIDWFTRETVVKDGRRTTRTIRHTEWLPLRGSAVDDHRDHLVCAAVGLGSREAAQLLPFDLGAAVRFAPELLAGWDAEFPTRPRAELDAAAHAEVARASRLRVQQQWLPGDHLRVHRLDGDVTLERAELVLLPVWIASYRYAGKVYRALIHGQDGRFVGRPPISALAVSLASGAVAAIVVALLWIAGVWR